MRDRTSPQGEQRGSILTLSRRQEKSIDALCQIAKRNQASLSLREVADLTSLGVGEQELSDAWMRSETLSSKYTLDSGDIIDRSSTYMGRDRGKAGRRERAERNLDVAKMFASRFRASKDLLLFSVSGSTSYLSASDQDDLDFFCITRDDYVWVFLLKALIKRRLFQRRGGEGSAPLCFSYVLGEGRARRLFSSPRNALFARDAIMAIVLKGRGFYRDLLRESDWIVSFFPSLYEAKISSLSEAPKRDPTDSHPLDSYSSRILKKLLNVVLFHTMGNYIRVKSYLLNRKFRRTGQYSRAFRVKISIDRCLFESSDYIELRRKYSEIKGLGK